MKLLSAFLISIVIANGSCNPWGGWELPTFPTFPTITLPPIKIPDLPSFITDFTSSITDTFKNIKSSAEKLVKDAVNTATTQINSVKGEVNSLLQGGVKDISSCVDKLKNTVQSLPEEIAKLGADTLQKLMDSAAREAQGAIVDLTHSLDDLMDGIEGEIKNVSNDCEGRITAIADKVLKELREAIEKQFGDYKVCGKTYGPIVANFTTNLIVELMNCPLKIKKDIEGIAKEISDLAHNVPKIIREGVDKFAYCIKEDPNKIDCLGNIQKTTLQDLKNSVKSIHDLRVRVTSVVLNAKREVGLCSLQKVLEACAAAGDLVKQIRTCIGK